MKKTLLTLIFFAFIMGISAQNIAEATEIEKKLAKINVEGWQNRLVLNVKQKEKMLEVVTQYEMSKNAIFKSDSDMDAKNKDLEALEKTHHDKVGELLNEKQFSTFNAQITEAKSGS